MVQAQSPLHDTISHLQAISEEERSTCLKLLSVLQERLSLANRGVWTYRTLAQWSGFKEPSELFQDCVQLLVVHPHLRALEMHLLYFSPHDREDVGIPLSVEQERAVLRNAGAFFDPQTGEKVENHWAHLVPYFVPTAQLQVQVAKRG
jgi:hypothetical protein